MMCANVISNIIQFPKKEEKHTDEEEEEEARE